MKPPVNYNNIFLVTEFHVKLLSVTSVACHCIISEKTYKSNFVNFVMVIGRFLAQKIRKIVHTVSFGRGNKINILSKNIYFIC